jgi:hypothetical protein
MPSSAPRAVTDNPPARPRAAVLAASAVLGLAGAACSADYDAGSTPEEQLCNVLVAELETFPDDFELEPVLDGAAGDPTDLPAELLAIAVAYRAHESAYDQLGEFRPAIEFTAHLVELSTDGLIGPSTLSPTVLDSALAIDEALGAGACEP